MTTGENFIFWITVPAYAAIFFLYFFWPLTIWIIFGWLKVKGYPIFEAVQNWLGIFALPLYVLGLYFTHFVYADHVIELITPVAEWISQTLLENIAVVIAAIPTSILLPSVIHRLPENARPARHLENKIENICIFLFGYFILGTLGFLIGLSGFDFYEPSEFPGCEVGYYTGRCF